MTALGIVEHLDIVEEIWYILTLDQEALKPPCCPVDLDDFSARIGGLDIGDLRRDRDQRGAQWLGLFFHVHGKRCPTQIAQENPARFCPCMLQREN